jgi:hypothetical protein
MARLEFFVVAEDISIDQTTNHASVFNILEAVRALGFPANVPKCVALSLWLLEEGDEERDFQTVLEITPPNGETHRVETNFRMARPRHRIINRVQGIPVEGPGELRFAVSLNGVHKATHVVTVEAPPNREQP